MAHDNTPCWDSLPSVIMLEIFSYLQHKDRINASVVCKNWRQALFHPSFWKEITFIFEDGKSIPWSRHLADCFGLSVQNATVRCQTPHCSPELETLLRNFRENRNLRKLFMEPTSSSLEWAVNDNDDVEMLTDPIYRSIMKIIVTSKQLEALTLGCIEELTEKSISIVEELAHYHGKHLTHLSLASVKEDPEDYKLLSLNSIAFQQFESLVVLSLDYDYMSNDMLESLNSGTLERLVIHVHNWKDDHPGTSVAAWYNFTAKNKRCDLRLNLLHAYTGVTVLDTEILKPSMPLTHFKALFCESVNVKALDRLSSWFGSTLKSVVWIDSMDEDEMLPPTHDQTSPESVDALVLMAWRCTSLKELIFIGHKYYQENMLAIARLRGADLQRFEFAERNIISEEETPNRIDEIRCEIDKILRGNWKAFTDAELTPVLIDAIAGDSRDVIMPLVLADAK